jgi:malonyl-CoA O-methyltransferase
MSKIRKPELSALINKKRVQQHFDKYAAVYDSYAELQIDMANVLLKKINTASSPSRILEIGCGTGNLTKMILDTYPDADLTINDISPRMLEVAVSKLHNQAGKINIINGDAEEWLGRVNQQQELSSNAWGLILSNAVFQWFNHPLDVAKACLKLLQPDGKLAFSTFGPRTFQEMHHAFCSAEQRLGLPALRRGQTFMTKTDWENAFLNSGWTFQWFEEERILHFDTVLEFLYSVKKIGASNALQYKKGQQEGLSKAVLKEMEHCYVEYYTDPEGIRVTYHLCYGVLSR